MKKALLSPWHTVCLMTVAMVLAACEPATPAPKMTETPAPSPAPGAPNVSSGDGVPSTSTDAVQGLNADAALVAASAQQAQELPSTAQPSSQNSPLAALQIYLNTYPSDSNVSFLEQGVLAQRLKDMLGKEYPVLLANLRAVGPLTEDDGRWFITGNRPHEGGKEAAAVVVDAAQNAVRVWMLHEGQVKEYLDPEGVQLPWPREVQTMLNNYQASMH